MSFCKPLENVQAECNHAQFIVNLEPVIFSNQNSAVLLDIFFHWKAFMRNISSISSNSMFIHMNCIRIVLGGVLTACLIPDLGDMKLGVLCLQLLQ